MLPEYEDDLTADFVVKAAPAKTWKVDMENSRLKNVAVDGLDAMPQAIFFALETPRFQHEILSWNYGVQLQELIGETPPLVYVKIKNAVTQALSVDDRITGVTDFRFSGAGKGILVRFTVQTIYGALEFEKEVA